MTKSLSLAAAEHLLAGIISCYYKAKPAFNSLPGIPAAPAERCCNASGSCRSVGGLEIVGTGYGSRGTALGNRRR